MSPQVVSPPVRAESTFSGATRPRTRAAVTQPGALTRWPIRRLRQYHDALVHPRASVLRRRLAAMLVAVAEVVASSSAQMCQRFEGPKATATPQDPS